MKKVIHYKNMPPRLNLTTLIVYWLLLDRFSAPQWVMAFYWLFVAFVLVAVGLTFQNVRYVDIFEE